LGNGATIRADEALFFTESTATMSTTAAARLLGKKYHTLYAMVRRGYIPAPSHKGAHGHYRWSPEDIERAKQIIAARSELAEVREQTRQLLDLRREPNELEDVAKPLLAHRRMVLPFRSPPSQRGCTNGRRRGPEVVSKRRS
jgi:DNA-binding transcriptional MerR regulator